MASPDQLVVVYSDARFSEHIADTVYGSSMTPRVCRDPEEAIEALQADPAAVITGLGCEPHTISKQRSAPGLSIVEAANARDIPVALIGYPHCELGLVHALGAQLPLRRQRDAYLGRYPAMGTLTPAEQIAADILNWLSHLPTLVDA